MRVAADVSPLELAEYQKAARLVLRHPLITAVLSGQDGAAPRAQVGRAAAHRPRPRCSATRS